MEPTSRLTIDLVETMMMLMMTRFIYQIPCQRNYPDPGLHSPSCGGGMEEFGCVLILCSTRSIRFDRITESLPRMPLTLNSITSSLGLPSWFGNNEQEDIAATLDALEALPEGTKVVDLFASQASSTRLVVALLAYVPDDNRG